MHSNMLHLCGFPTVHLSDQEQFIEHFLFAIKTPSKLPLRQDQIGNWKHLKKRQKETQDSRGK